MFQDQYILHRAESQDITLPFACRHGNFLYQSCFYLIVTMSDNVLIYRNYILHMRFLLLTCLSSSILLLGCCTSCAVRIKSGQIRQPEALGISAELKAKVIHLSCHAFG
jgi:ferredoxin